MGINNHFSARIQQEDLYFSEKSEQANQEYREEKINKAKWDGLVPEFKSYKINQRDYIIELTNENFGKEVRTLNENRNIVNFKLLSKNILHIRATGNTTMSMINEGIDFLYLPF